MEREMKNLENLMWDDDYTDDDEFEAELEWGDEYDQLAEDLEKLQRKTKKEIRSFMKESNPSWKPTKNADLSDLISEFKKEHGPKDKGNLPSDANKLEGGEKEGDLIVEPKDDEKAKKYERRISSLEGEMLAAVKRKDYAASNRLSKEIMGLEREYRKIMNAK